MFSRVCTHTRVHTRTQLGLQSLMKRLSVEAICIQLVQSAVHAYIHTRTCVRLRQNFTFSQILRHVKLRHVTSGLFHTDASRVASLRELRHYVSTQTTPKTSTNAASRAQKDAASVDVTRDGSRDASSMKHAPCKSTHNNSYPENQAQYPKTSKHSRKHPSLQPKATGVHRSSAKPVNNGHVRFASPTGP